MSREPIPTVKRGSEQGDVPWLKQICVIPFTREYPLQFNEMEPTALEIAESVDLNRCLEHGHIVQMGFSPDIAVSVDTPEDLAHAEEVFKGDALAAQYLPAAQAQTGT